MCDVAGRLEETVSRLTDENALLRNLLDELVRRKAAPVSTNILSPEEVEVSRVEGRLHVTSDGYGYVVVPSAGPEDERGLRLAPQISVYGGGYFHFLAPDPSMVDIHSVVHSLSRIARFTGHLRGGTWTVAQHSLLVAFILQLAAAPPTEQFRGLLHDGAEAFLGDVSAPLKQLLPDYRRVEKRVEPVVARAFGLGALHSPLVSQADECAMHIEASHLSDWPWTSRERADELLRALVPGLASYRRQAEEYFWKLQRSERSKIEEMFHAQFGRLRAEAAAERGLQ
jgi:hypothetical protein